ncbi:hypothetical protein MRX96_041205 [Rhipicephalus microplus]
MTMETRSGDPSAAGQREWTLLPRLVPAERWESAGVRRFGLQGVTGRDSGASRRARSYTTLYAFASCGALSIPVG